MGAHPQQTEPPYWQGSPVWGLFFCAQIRGMPLTGVDPHEVGTPNGSKGSTARGAGAEEHARAEEHRNAHPYRPA